MYIDAVNCDVFVLQHTRAQNKYICYLYFSYLQFVSNIINADVVHCTQKVDSAVRRTECLAWNSETTELLRNMLSSLAHVLPAVRLYSHLALRIYIQRKTHEHKRKPKPYYFHFV